MHASIRNAGTIYPLPGQVLRLLQRGGTVTLSLTGPPTACKRKTDAFMLQSFAVLLYLTAVSLSCQCAIHIINEQSEKQRCEQLWFAGNLNLRTRSYYKNSSQVKGVSKVVCMSVGCTIAQVYVSDCIYV